MKSKTPDPGKIGFRKKLALNVFAKYRHNQTLEHELRYLFWECTLRCNLNCIHCGSDCTRETSTPDMPLGDFLGVVDVIKDHVNPNKTMIALTGGEPLVRPDLDKCGLELNRRGFPWGIVTNGCLLDGQRLSRLLDSGLMSITISLDGLKENHDWFRGRQNSFEKALGAVSLVAKIQGLTYDVATCVHKKNLGQLEDIYRLLLDTGVKNWRLFTIFPRGRAAGNEILMPDKEILVTLFEFIRSKKAEGKMRLTYGCEGFLGKYEGEARDSFFFCHAGINIGSVLIDGSISACPSIRNDFVQGNIYSDSFMDVWNNRYQVMRDRQWTKSGICSGCKSYKYCNGSGLHLHDEKTGELMFCHLETMCK